MKLDTAAWRSWRWFLQRIRETFPQKELNERGVSGHGLREEGQSGSMKPAALLKCYKEDIKHGHLIRQLLQG